MQAEIKRIATSLDLSQGGLLKLARDVSHDGALLSVRHMRRCDQKALLAFLRQIAEAQRVSEERHARAIA